MTFNHKLVDEFLETIFPLPEEFGVSCYECEDYFELETIFPLPEEFGVSCYECEDYFEPIDFLFFQKAVRDVDPDATICFGMSKMVIISPNLGNVVIKIPFNGYYTEKETGEDLDWHPFCGAAGSDPNDYCLTEFEKYNRLKTYGLDCFVAKVMFYKEMCGVRIFLQEQVIPENDSYCTRRPSRKSQDLANKWYDEGKFYIEPEWIANCLDKYGESKVERFLYYCANIDPDILDDVHGGNFGYRKDETPCILDFSNYSD